MKRTVELLKTLRKNAKVSQRLLSKSIHVSSRDISQIENGTMDLTFETACKCFSFLFRQEPSSIEKWAPVFEAIYEDISEDLSNSLNLKIEINSFNDGSPRTDLVVKFPDGKCLVMEAKITDAKGMKNLREQHRKDLINAIKTIPPSKFGRLSGFINSINDD